MAMRNKISVALATYNGSKYVREQLNSLILQSRKIDEFIIVDDCSDDNTIEIVTKFFENHFDNDVRIVKNDENLGYIRNFRKAISLCTGDIIFLCDQDDIWYKDKIQSMVEIMENDNNIKLLASSFDFIDELGNPIKIRTKSGYSNNNLLHETVKSKEVRKIPIDKVIFRNFTQGCATCFSKDIQKVFINNPDDKIPHDWQLNMIAACLEGLYFFNETLFGYRLHNSNTTGLFPFVSIKDKMTFEYRSNISSIGVRNCKFVKSLFREVYDRYNLEKKYRFGENHTNYILKKKFFKVLMQNLNYNYGDICSFKGRLMDLLYCLFSKDNFLI